MRYEGYRERLGQTLVLTVPNAARFRMTSETASPPRQSVFGRFDFNNAFTNNPASPGGTGNTIASMLLGYPSNNVRDFFVPGRARLHTEEYNWFFSDDWRVNHKLTLNLGVDYEINTPFREENDFWVNFDPATAELLIAGQNSDRRAGITTDYRSIGPRFGFAYQLTPRPSCAAATASSTRRRLISRRRYGSFARSLSI